MGQLYNEDWEHVDIEAFREAIIGNGVITGLAVTQSDTPGMSIKVSLGQCTIDAVVYAESSNQNLNISNGDATHDRKDIVVYDATAGNPAVVAGTPAAAPVPPDIPDGDILLGIVLVEANETTSILDADITEDRVYAINRLEHTAVSANTTLNDAHYVVTVDATGGVRTITLPTAVGILGKVYIVKKIDSTTNAVTVDGSAAETIDGAANVSLPSQWASTIIQSDGTNWIKVATDKTNNEIRDAVEAATDSNTFKDADHDIVNDAIVEAVFNANTILKADTDNTPAALTVAEQTLVGRITAGVITALTATQVRTLIGVADGADVTGANVPQAHTLTHAQNGSDTITTYSLSDDILFSDDAVASESSTTMTLMKTMTLSATPDTIRIKFRHHGQTATTLNKSQIYRNGGAVGALNAWNDTSNHEISEDISGWSAGDTVEIWGRGNTLTHIIDVSNFRLCGDYIPILHRLVV